MPIEIKEVHIKVTVSSEADRAAGDAAELLLAFGDPAPGPRDDVDHPSWFAFDDPAAPVLFGEAGDAAAKSSQHTNGVNYSLSDGSVRFVADGLDLFG